jgi:hypothetical protein
VPLVGVDDIAGFDQRVAGPPVPAAAAESAALLTSADTLTWPDADSVAPAAGAATDGELVEVEPAAAQAAEEVTPEPVAAEEPEVPVAPPPPVTTPTPRRDLRDTFLRGPILPPPVAASKEEVPESLAARRSQLDSLGIDDPGEGTVSVGQRTALPYRSSGAGSAAGGSATLAAVWDASTRALMEGAQRASLRPCGSCGLTVSSTARFCRRCGTPQTLSA